MTNRLILFLLLAVSAAGFACNQPAANKTNANESPVKTGVQPQPDSEIAVIEFPDYGTVKVELYSNIAPKMVERFKALATEGVYNRTLIHRVDTKLGIIQGGDPLSKDDDPKNDGSGSSGKPNVPAEFSDVFFDTGILGAARSTSPDSANSQFFIMTKRQANFDKRYTIFGKVIEGQEIVNLISRIDTENGSERPARPVIINRITIQKK